MSDWMVIFQGKLNYILNNIISEKEKKLQFNLIFKEYINTKEYTDLYNVFSYLIEEPTAWIPKTWILSEIKNTIHSCEDETMLIEFIDQGKNILNEVLKMPPKDIPINQILEYYIVLGQRYWNLEIYDTAIRAYEDALYITKGLQSNSEAMLKLILRITKYYERLSRHKLASQKSFLGYEIATHLGDEGWIEAFSKHVEDNNAIIGRVYAYAAQALIWDNDERTARNNIIRAIQALAEIILVQNNVQNLESLINTIISTFRTFRILDQADNDVINILRDIPTQMSSIDLIDIARGLINYCQLAYIPVLYTMMIISDTGSLVYSRDIEDFTKGDKVNQEVTLFSDMGKNLYSGLFSAMSMSMKQALGSSEAVNAIEYAGKVIMIEESDTFITYLVIDRETYEIRSNLKKLTQDVNESFKNVNPMMIASRGHMEDLINPIFKKYFSAFIENQKE